MVAVKTQTRRQPFKQIVHILRHQVRPVHYVPVLSNQFQEGIRMGPDESSGRPLPREQYLPGLDNQRALFGEGRVVWRRSNLHGPKLPPYAQRCQFESQELEDVVPVLKVSLGIVIHVFKKAGDRILEMAIHLPAYLCLNYRNGLVVLLRPQRNLAHTTNTAPIGSSLVRTNCLQDVLNLRRQLERKLQLVQQP